MTKTSIAVGVWVFAIIAWIGVFFPPQISGTAIRAETHTSRTETLCYQDCPGKFNGHRQVQHG